MHLFCSRMELHLNSLVSLTATNSYKTDFNCRIGNVLLREICFGQAQSLFLEWLECKNTFPKILGCKMCL